MNSASQLDINVDQDWAALIRSHQNDVWRYLRSLGCTPNQADDLTQETFLRVMERPFQSVNARATAAYLRKVAHSRFISLCRRESKSVDSNHIEAIDQYWKRELDGRHTDDLVDYLRECLQRLTDRARQALQLRYAEHASRQQIADALNMTTHGAKNVLQRAKQKLRACVEEKQRRAESRAERPLRQP